MQAIILAAGMGKRLQEYTRDNTKCMVRVNGITIIERCLRILDRKKLSRIVIVVGYKGENLVEFIDSLNIVTPICYINNHIYDKTNNIYSLALAKEYLCCEDTLLLESDLVFEEKVIDLLLEDSRSTLALVDKFESWMEHAWNLMQTIALLTLYLENILNLVKRKSIIKQSIYINSVRIFRQIFMYHFYQHMKKQWVKMNIMNL